MTKTEEQRRVREEQAKRREAKQRASEPQKAEGWRDATTGEWRTVASVAAENRAEMARESLYSAVTKAVEMVTAREGEPAQRLDVRLRAGERAKLLLAADLAGLPLSVWARDVLLREASKVDKTP